MAEFRVNEQCIIGLPACGYGFNSSRMCFIARPADDDFELETEILSQLLKDRNYETYVALQNTEPGSFAFCKKICSKIITSQFCIVLLNRSEMKGQPTIKIPNPNIHFEYGMMLSFHKHVIPMQLEEESLAFNIYPLDTIKYSKGTFKKKAEDAIEDAILRFSAKSPPGRPIGAADDVIKYYAFRGLRYVTRETGGTAGDLFALGAPLGFDLFANYDEFVFFGYFHQEEPREIIARLKWLLDIAALAYKKLADPLSTDELKLKEELEQRKDVISTLNKVRIELMIPEDANLAAMQKRACELRDQAQQTNLSELLGVQSKPIPLTFLRPSELMKGLEQEYEKLGF